MANGKMEISDIIELFNIKFSQLEKAINQINTNFDDFRKEIQQSKVDFVQNKTASSMAINELQKDVDRNFDQHRAFYERLGILEQSKERNSEVHEKFLSLIEKLEIRIEQNQKSDNDEKESVNRMIQAIKTKSENELKKHVEEYQEFKAWVKSIYIKATTFITIIGTVLGWLATQLIDYLKG